MDGHDSTRVANSLSAIEDCLWQMSRPCYMLRPTIIRGVKDWRVEYGGISATGSTIALALEHFDSMVRM